MLILKLGSGEKGYGCVNFLMALVQWCNGYSSFLRDGMRWDVMRNDVGPRNLEVCNIIKSI